MQRVPLQHFAADLFLVGRSIMILRGLIHQLGLDLKVQRAVQVTCSAALPPMPCPGGSL